MRYRDFLQYLRTGKPIHPPPSRWLGVVFLIPVLLLGVWLAAAGGAGMGSGCPEGCLERRDGCEIKGNVSWRTGEKIYHVPGQRYYDEAEIDPDRGERWFCTEKEARANGWRRAKV